MLCRKRYSSRYDPMSTEMWFRNNVLKNPLLFFPIRTDHAFTISTLHIWPWLPSEYECHMMMICADDDAMWEVVTLLRATIEYARKRKCVCWRVTSETDFDLTPIAQRLGAREESPRFTLRLS
jgi:hypothetical protein